MKYGLGQFGWALSEYEANHEGRVGVSGMTVQEAFLEMARVINTCFPTPRDQGYAGNRCGWYPERPRRKRRKSA